MLALMERFASSKENFSSAQMELSRLCVSFQVNLAINNYGWTSSYFSHDRRDGDDARAQRHSKAADRRRYVIDVKCPTELYECEQHFQVWGQEVET